MCFSTGCVCFSETMKSAWNSLRILTTSIKREPQVACVRLFSGKGPDVSSSANDAAVFNQVTQQPDDWSAASDLIEDLLSTNSFRIHPRTAHSAHCLPIQYRETWFWKRTEMRTRNVQMEEFFSKSPLLASCDLVPKNDQHLPAVPQTEVAPDAIEDEITPDS